MTRAEITSVGIADLLAARDGTFTTSDGRAAREILATRLLEVRHEVVSNAEQLYRSAVDQAERAHEGLEEFDRQSEGALREASTSVEMARQAVRQVGMDGRGAGQGDRLAQLEARLLLAQATELNVLRSRIETRAPLEGEWGAAAAAVCVWGGALLRAAEEGRGAGPPRSADTVGGGHVHTESGPGRSQPGLSLLPPRTISSPSQPNDSGEPS